MYRQREASYTIIVTEAVGCSSWTEVRGWRGLRSDVHELRKDRGGELKVQNWHEADESLKAAILIEPDVPKTQGISVPDPIQTYHCEAYITCWPYRYRRPSRDHGFSQRPTRASVWAGV